MRGIGCVNCEKFRCDFMAQTCALIALFQSVLHQFRLLTKHCQMQPITMKHTKTWVYDSIGWIECVHFEKFWRSFMARTCALILSFQPALHRLSCNNKTIQNPPKHYEMLQNMSLGSNWGGLVCSLRKILMRLYGTTLCIDCTCSTRFAPSFV